jgi:hypothetical protein
MSRSASNVGERRLRDSSVQAVTISVWGEVTGLGWRGLRFRAILTNPRYLGREVWASSPARKS